MLLHFDETPEAEEAQIQACDEQHTGDDTQAALHIPVHMSKASSSQYMACLLASRGVASGSSSCPELDTHLRRVYGGGGDLPTQYASQQAAGGVGNADACLILIWPPPGDWDLGQLGLASEYSVQPDELPQPSPAHQMQPYFRGCHSPVTCTHSHTLRLDPAPGAAALPVLLQGLQLPVLRLQTVGFPTHIAGPPALGPRSARSCRLSRPL